MAERGRPRAFDRTAALRRAMEVFWARDYDGASLAELKSAMGINAPSLYAAFGSKADLFREAVELYTASEGVEIWRDLDETPRAKEAVTRFLRLSAETFTKPGKPRGCLIALGVLHPNEANTAACADLRARRRMNVLTLRRRLERGVDEGDLPAGFDCAGAAAFYAAVQQGMSTHARDGASREELLAIARGAIGAWKTFASSGAPARGRARATAGRQAREHPMSAGRRRES
jgi:AcrR family transcriptional regulator